MSASSINKPICQFIQLSMRPMSKTRNAPIQLSFKQIHIQMRMDVKKIALVQVLSYICSCQKQFGRQPSIKLPWKNKGGDACLFSVGDQNNRPSGVRQVLKIVRSHQAATWFAFCPFQTSTSVCDLSRLIKSWMGLALHRQTPIRHTLLLDTEWNATRAVKRAFRHPGSSIRWLGRNSCLWFIPFIFITHCSVPCFVQTLFLAARTQLRH